MTRVKAPSGVSHCAIENGLIYFSGSGTQPGTFFVRKVETETWKAVTEYEFEANSKKYPGRRAGEDILLWARDTTYVGMIHGALQLDKSCV